MLSARPLRERAQVKGTENRTYLLIRSGLLAMGAIAMVLLIQMLIYYRSHFQLELVVDKGEPWTDAGTLSVHRQDPDGNVDVELASFPLFPSSVQRAKLSTGDLLLFVTARYQDHLPRALNFHIKQEAGLDFHKKFVRISLPSPASIRAHPNMAFIPATTWLQGPDRKVESAAPNITGNGRPSRAHLAHASLWRGRTTRSFYRSGVPDHGARRSGNAPTPNRLKRQGCYRDRVTRGSWQWHRGLRSRCLWRCSARASKSPQVG
jgi:hypothetical protein